MDFKELKQTLDKLSADLAVAIAQQRVVTQPAAAIDYDRLGAVITKAILDAGPKHSSSTPVEEEDAGEEVAPPPATDGTPAVEKAPRKRRTKAEMEAIRIAQQKVEHAAQFAPAPVAAPIPAAVSSPLPAAILGTTLLSGVMGGTPTAAPQEQPAALPIPTQQELIALCQEFQARYGNNEKGEPIILTIMDALKIEDPTNMTLAERDELNRTIQAIYTLKITNPKAMTPVERDEIHKIVSACKK